MLPANGTLCGKVGVGFCFRRKERSVETAFRRIVAGQCARAIEEVAAADVPEAVHAVRKRCKRLRALFRLVRPVFPDYAAANGAVRDAAQVLSGTRDADVLIATAEALFARHGRTLDRRAVAAVRAALGARRDIAAGAAGGCGQIEARLGEFREAIGDIAARSADWSLTGSGVKALRGGYAATYRRARKDMRRAVRRGAHEDFHEWRKPVKYHANQTLLLRRLLPGGAGRRTDALDALAETLGDAHDLFVLREVLAGDEAGLADGQGVREIVAKVDARCTRLEAAALRTGARLFATSPGAMARQIGGLKQRGDA
jgi:CHAD domain-containing protein